MLNTTVPRAIFFTLLLLLLTACKEQIIHNLSEKDANRLLTRLHAIEIQPEKVRQPDGKWAISVKKSSAFKAIKYLNDTRVFRENYPVLNEKASILTSRESQRFRFERALSKEIEATLASVEGVLEARVHLNLPATDPLFGRALESVDLATGSVLLVTLTNSSISKEQIALLVGGASGIAPAKISVLINNASGQLGSKQEELIKPALAATAGITDTALAQSNQSSAQSFNIGLQLFRARPFYLLSFSLMLLLIGAGALSFVWFSRSRATVRE
ncbi:hypothetical protein OAO01_08955 [Oligoflexia bacterium]|nr:hypothetical protein [Oligoflexia bacterium]